MIPVVLTQEPVDFDADCRQKGLRWLATHPPEGDEALRNYWRNFIPQLCAAFNNKCGYLAMLDLNGTVDHFLSTHNNRTVAYEWSNYRYATGWLNSSKQKLDQAVIDPFDVREGWFEIDLASLHLRITPALPKRLKNRAAFTIKRLGLDFGRRTIQNRQFYYAQYRTKQIPLEYLEQVAPLIAMAVRREQVLSSLAGNSSVSRQNVATICQVSILRASELLKMWRDAGHLRSFGRGPNVRYRLP